MNPSQVKIVRNSWRKLMGIDPFVLGDVFYTKLFTDHPELRRLFPKDMTEQNKKLVDMLTSIVSGLEQVEGMKAEIINMAKRHTGYGVRPAHYKMVGNALMWTLAKGLQEDWNEEVKGAWLACYDTLSSLMISNARP